MNCPWNTEDIPDEDFVFRQIHFRFIEKDPLDKTRRIPNDSQFIPDPDGLSVNWERYCDLRQVFIIIGTSKNFSNKYKNPRDFQAIKLNVGYLRNIDGISDVLHTPIFYDTPSEKDVDNRGHASVIYGDDPEIRVKLCDYVMNNPSVILKPNFDEVMEEVNKLREQKEQPTR